MLLPDQIDFYNRWQHKADNILLADIGDYIDKYVTLFINYNALYNITPRKVALRDHTPVKSYGDKAGATKKTQEFLGTGTILQHISPEMIEHLAASMVHFNIKLNYNGEAQPKEDARLLRQLQGTNAEEKCLAILEILYYVRCNIVHGNKTLEPYQIMILEPVINILNIMNRLLFNKLETFAL